MAIVSDRQKEIFIADQTGILYYDTVDIKKRDEGRSYEKGKTNFCICVVGCDNGIQYQYAGCNSICTG